MNILFCPALGQTVNIRPTVNLLPVHLQFSAEVNIADYESLIADGGILQIWTDIPTCGGYTGEWHAYTYSIKPHGSNSEEGQTTVYLTSCITIPAKSILTQTRFSFTFRIVYPGKQIQWLGGYGQNGFISLHPSPRVQLTGGWTQVDERLHWKGQAEEVARIDNLEDSSIWAFGLGDSFGKSENPSILCLLPKKQFDRLCTRGLVFYATSGATMKLSSSGVLTSMGSGALFLCALSHHSETLRHIAEHTGEVASLVDCDAKNGHLVLSSPLTMNPTTFVVLPFYTAPRTLELDLVHHLRPFLPGDGRQFVLHPPLPSESCLMDIPSSGIDKLTITVGSTGDPFIMAPVHRLASAKVTIPIAILSAHSVTCAHSHALPTPPSSPTPSATRLGNVPKKVVPSEKSTKATPRSMMFMVPGRNWVSKMSSMRVPRRSRIFGLATFVLVLLTAAFVVMYRVTKVILGKYLSWFRYHREQKSSSPLQKPLHRDASKTYETSIKKPSDPHKTGIAMEKPVLSIDMKLKECPGVIAFSPVGLALSCPIKITQHGQPLHLTVRELNDTLSLVEFEGRLDGLVSIYPSLGAEMETSE